MDKWTYALCFRCNDCCIRWKGHRTHTTLLIFSALFVVAVYFEFCLQSICIIVICIYFKFGLFTHSSIYSFFITTLIFQYIYPSYEYKNWLWNFKIQLTQAGVTVNSIFIIREVTELFFHWLKFWQEDFYFRSTTKIWFLELKK